jgi:hypothetical protein
MNLKRALWYSITGHLFVFLVLAIADYGFKRDFTPPVIYAVTLEGGMKLGGKQQTPKDQRKVPIAPPKNVQELEKQNKIDPKIDPKLKCRLTRLNQRLPLRQNRKRRRFRKPHRPNQRATPVPKATPKPTPKKPAPVDIDKELEKAVQRYSGESTDAGGKGFGAGRMGGAQYGWRRASST